ncbi:MAG: 16S rRNA processing protein RimM [Blastocatellia bacterium]|nr:16S rRNA processing protein RimM [Blastocatellia bacterium]
MRSRLKTRVKQKYSNNREIPVFEKVKSPSKEISALSQESSKEGNSDAYQLSEELISVANIVRPQGIRGEVVAEIVTDFPERFEVLDSVYLCSKGVPLQRAELEGFWFHKGRIVLKFSSIDTRDQAEALRGFSVKIPRSSLVELPSDTYFEFDLIGCKVETLSGNTLGKVREIMPTGAAPLLVVESEEGKEILLPFADAICPTVDIASKLIVVKPPEGLLDL